MRAGGAHHAVIRKRSGHARLGKDRILTRQSPGLEIEYTELFDEVLRIMRTSDDRAVKYLVDKILDKIEQSTSTTLSSADQKQATSKGNHLHVHKRSHANNKYTRARV